ncbi:unnamed protein product [Vicia faba]|uniref:Retroviral polymerase SH3-like domain-containing protein n=1 Tax=Vicia faba TaxID=3906 RepID=A0AAV1ABC5_VICFA|nr:unnamed protein product [Vicia faba]
MRSSGGDIENPVMTGLSKEQWKTLVEMLNTSKVTSNESMTCKTKLNAWIIDSGASNHMTRIIQHLCNVKEDRTSKMLIGAGERRDGLYLFWEVLKVKANKLVSNCNGSSVGELKNKVCDTCQRAKQTRETFSLSNKQDSDIFDLIHCDLWGGAYRTPSSCCASYFLTIVDDCSRAGERVLTAGYLINRTPSSILKGKSPYEILHGHAPCYTHLRVFGSLCFARNQHTNGDKFATRSRRCVFVGYPYGQKGWRVYDLESRELFVSRDVIFSENQFPFHEIEKQKDDVRTNRTMLELPITEEDDMENKNKEDGEESTDAVTDPIHIQTQTSHDENENESLGRGCRVKYPFTQLQDYVTNTVHKLSPLPCSSAQSHASVGLLGAKPAPTPLEQNHRLSLATGPLLSNPKKYRRLVGRLIYLCFTRPELSYCVHILSQFMHEPRTDHWEVALRVVRFLKGNPGQGIFLSQQCDLQLHGWCDSDWASCPLTRRSVTGWLVQLGDSPISWKTKK